MRARVATILIILGLLMGLTADSGCRRGAHRELDGRHGTWPTMGSALCARRSPRPTTMPPSGAASG